MYHAPKRKREKHAEGTEGAQHPYLFSVETGSLKVEIEIGQYNAGAHDKEEVVPSENELVVSDVQSLCLSVVVDR
jgi:hypothetical protein